MSTQNLKQKDKAMILDLLNSKFENGELEMLLKEDDTGEMDFYSVTSLYELVMHLEITDIEPKKQEYVKLTRSEFNKMREEIYSSYSASGSMDTEAADCAEDAYRSVKRAELRNLIEPLV